MPALLSFGKALNENPRRCFGVRLNGFDLPFSAAVDDTAILGFL